MAYFHETYHEICALRYVEGVLVLRKLDFRGLKGQYDAKKANFRGLIVKIGHYWPIWATRTHLWPIFYGVFHGNYALTYVGGVLVLRKLDFRGLKCQ